MPLRLCGRVPTQKNLPQRISLRPRMERLSKSGKSWKSGPPSTVFVGKKLQNWTAISESGVSVDGRVCWLWRCACGKETIHRSRIQSKSCGSCVKTNKLRPFESLYRHFIRQAAENKRETDIFFEDFLKFTEIKTCYYCGGPIRWVEYCGRGPGSQKFNLDRKDNSVGYLKSNVVVCCTRCNRAKSNHFTHDEWLQLGRIIRSWSIT
jgi:hypothetical protein